MTQKTAPTWWSLVTGRMVAALSLALAIGCANDEHAVEPTEKSALPLAGPVTLTLTAPKNVSVLAPTLSAKNSIFMGAGSEVIQTGLSIAMGSGGLLTEPDVLMNETWSRGHVELRQRTRIRGTLHTANPTLLADVVIQSRDNAPVFDPVSSLAWTIDFPAGGTDLTIPQDGLGSLLPGRHGIVTVGPRATLTLSAGTYYLTKLLVEPQATVRLDQATGPVILYVSDTFQPRGAFVSTVPGTSPDLFVAFLGTTPTYVEVPFNGAIFAPLGQLVLRAVTPEHIGFFAAKDLLVDAHARVRYRYPLALIPATNPTPTACRELVPPDQVARYCPGCQSSDDTDLDGILDCADLCPYDATKAVPGTCGCGSPETDTDLDTFPDCIDRCRLDPDNVTPGQCGCKGEENLKPSGFACSDPACPQSGATCNGAGVCGNRAACSPCPGGRYVLSGGSGYWLCGVGVPPTLPGPDGGIPDGGLGPEPPEPDAGTDAGTDGGTPPVGVVPRGNAATACGGKGLNLVRIDSPIENRYIQRLISYPLWLGANSITTANAWRWSTAANNNGDQFWSGGPTGTRVGNRYANWAAGEPGVQRCAAMQPRDGRWIDADCTASYGFVCEYTTPVTGGTGDGGADSGVDDPPPGIQRQPRPLGSCVPESSSGLTDNYDDLVRDRAAADAGIFQGAAANPPPDGSTCPPDDPAAEAIGLHEFAGCSFLPISTSFQCFRDADCAPLGAGLYCRQSKDDQACHPPDAGDVTPFPVPGEPCEAHGLCGTLTCPPISPPRCGEVTICNPGTEFDAGVDPGSDLDASPYNPAQLFDGGVPDAAPTGAYVDPPTGTGKNHSWCKLNPQDPASVAPASQPSSAKSGSSGSGTSISFAFDPDLIFDVNANPLSFGESDLSLHAQAKFVATASLNNFLGQSYTAPIIDVVAGVTAQRCSISTDETHFQVLGLDFVDEDDLPRVNTDDPTISTAAYEASKACKDGLAEFKLWGDRAKKAFRDAQNLVAQYQNAKAIGAAFGTDLCTQLGIASKTVPFFPGGNSCAPNEPPEITINRLIQFYQEPGIGQITQLRNAASALSNATAQLRNLLGTEIALDFINKSNQESQTIVNVPFAIGPIPMVLQVDVFAKYGIGGRFNLELNFPTNLDAAPSSIEQIARARVEVGPYASAGLSAFVGAGVSLGPIEATLGLEGAITLADVRAPIFAGAGVNLQIDKDPRPLPTDIAPPISTGLEAFQFGLPKSFKFLVSYDYGAGLDLRDVLSGEINARLRIKFFFFSRTWRKRVVRFNGWSFHYDLVSGGSDPSVTTTPQTVPGGDGRTTTQVAQGEATMGRSEAQVPLTKLALLPVPPPIFNGDELSDAGVGDGGDAGPPTIATLSKSQVEEFFYDDLCCSKEGEECASSGSPSCCPELECQVADGGTTGVCGRGCAREGEYCGYEGGLPCCGFELFCSEDARCHY
jgi:hypothetical protein